MINKFGIIITLLPLCILFFNPIASLAQEDKRTRRSFIGASLGMAIPTGSFASKNETNNNPVGFANNGFHIKLVHAAFVLKNNFGISGSWYGSVNGLETTDTNGLIGQVWGYGGIVIGPMYTIPINRFQIDFKAEFGYSVATILESSVTGVFRNEGETSTTLAKNFGLGFRYHITEKASLIWEIDYYNANAKFDMLLNGNRQEISAFNAVFGAVIRL